MEVEAPLGLFDMDGTLFDFEGQMRKDMLTLMSPNEKEEDLFNEELPWIKARMKFIKTQPGWWRNLPTLDAGWDVYKIAKSIGFNIQILTKGPHKNWPVWSEKCECIDLHFPDVSINIVSGIKNKGNYYGSFLCEDHVPFLQEWLLHRPRGLGILIPNKGNSDFQHPNVIRYTGDNKAEIEQYLQAVFSRKEKQHWRELL